jgi:hypothetical protein
MGTETDTLANRVVVGWKEYMAFPDWHLSHVRAKVDTGACTSALGVVSYRLETVSSPGDVVFLKLDLFPHRPERIREVRVPVVAQVMVKNTSGQAEQRPVILARIQLGPIDKLIRMTVANRAGMRYSILLGREALAGHFVVDVTQKYRLSRS